MSIGDVVRTRRLAAGLTEDDAARKAGISRPAWSDIERGAVRRPRVRTLESIARALGVELDDLRSQTTPDIDPDDPKRDALLQLWGALPARDRDELMADMVRRMLAGRSFEDADELLQAAAL